MCSKYADKSERGSEQNYRVLEVKIMKKSALRTEGSRTQHLLVAGEHETLSFVQDNMDDFIGNLLRTKQLEEKEQRRVEENSRLFEENLEPLFNMLANTTGSQVLQKMSASLKKALLLMAMDRYASDPASICQVLGITQTALEREINACGLTLARKAVR
jgi:hypothetical protein